MPPRPDRSGFVAAFLRHEAAGGLLLIGAALLALIVANSPLAGYYAALLHTRLGPLDLHGWINDALMALFFFTVGLEVKRECVTGALAAPGARLLPASAAVAGMIAPAILYLLAAGRTPGAAPGWAVPAATDIAFVQAVLVLAGARAPLALRLFLTTLAIIDDIGAAAIIAIGYTARIDPGMLVTAMLIVAVMLLLARRGIDRGWPYLLLGLLAWIATYRSGVHGTVAGVAAGLAVPAVPGRGAGTPLGERMEGALHPWVAFAILPLFGFANAGLTLRGLRAADLLAPIPLGIVLGLVVGKPLGVAIGTVLPIRLGLARRPDGVSARQLLAGAMLAGIGFTMSLFIGGLAFADPARIGAVKLGVLAGSCAAAILGYAVLRTAPACQPPRH